jgi:hypothetical protein
LAQGTQAEAGGGGAARYSSLSLVLGWPYPRRRRSVSHQPRASAVLSSADRAEIDRPVARPNDPRFGKKSSSPAFFFTREY